MASGGDASGEVHDRASIRDALTAVVLQAERVARVEVHLVVEKAKLEFHQRLNELLAKSARKAVGVAFLLTGYALVVGAAVSALSVRVGAWQAFLLVGVVHGVAGAILAVSPSVRRDASVLTNTGDRNDDSYSTT